MRVHEVMTRAPASCEPTTRLRLVAQLMADHDCAAIPITRSGELLGLITDRDITCRAVANGYDAGRTQAGAIMTTPLLVVRADDPLEKAAELMKANRVHHLPVIAADGQLVGIVAQSDLGRRMTNREFGELARDTSIRSARASFPGPEIARVRQ